METEGRLASKSRIPAMRKLRAKTRKPQSLQFISPSNLKKKKPEQHVGKLMKANLKKKKKTINPKKVPNQIDFAAYKKLFSTAFAKFDAVNNSAFKTNFHGLFNQIKTNTEDSKTIVPTEEEKQIDMGNFMKIRKECINAKTFEKTQKIFDSTLSLVEKDPSFVDNFDMAKISNNITDDKIKLEQCRKIVQKYNLNKEPYHTSSYKDDEIEQLVFTKRLKMYETMKQTCNFSFDDLDYYVEFVSKDPVEASSGSVLGKRKIQDDSETVASVLDKTKDFADILTTELRHTNKMEESFVENLKDTQLDYILKFNKMEEINPFLKNLKMIAGGNIHLDNIDLKDGEDKSLGWKIFKDIISQNIDNGGLSARKSLEIMGTKERFRTQKKNEDFLYYEPSSGKKSIIPHAHTNTHNQNHNHNHGHETTETKKIPKDKHISSSSRKKSHHEHAPKPTPVPASHLNHSAEKGIADDVSDSVDTQPSTLLKPMKPEMEEMRSIKLAESLIDDYRAVLHHAFKNLSQQDPNFIHQAVHQDHDIEKKTGIRLLNLPQATAALNGLFHRDLSKYQAEDFLLNGLSAAVNEVVYPYTSAAQFSPSILPGYSGNVISNITTPPLQTNYIAVPVLVNTPQMLNQPVPLKSVDNSLTPSNSYTKMKSNGELIIPELRNSPQVKSTKNQGIYSNMALGEPAVKKNLVSEARNGMKGEDLKGVTYAYLNGDILKEDEVSGNGNHFTIFNSMDQGGEDIKRPMPVNLGGNGDLGIKKNNIILTRTNFSEG